MNKGSPILICLWTFLLATSRLTGAFTVAPSIGATPPSTTKLAASTKPEPTLTASEEKIFEFLQELHQSKLAFRIVVIGNGAILESTNPLGPNMSLNQSPKSGANLVTFASEDKSYELHLQTNAISKVSLVEKETPGRTMRILRLVNSEGQSICSLILSEDSDATAKWFQTMTSKYGNEWQV